jgi:hypothetical protein
MLARSVIVRVEVSLPVPPDWFPGADLDVLAYEAKKAKEQVGASPAVLRGNMVLR